MNRVELHVMVNHSPIIPGVTGGPASLLAAAASTVPTGYAAPEGDARS